MNRDRADQQDQQPVGDTPRDRGAWYATFTFLDVGSVISASQVRRLVAVLARFWRRTFVLTP